MNLADRQSRFEHTKRCTRKARWWARQANNLLWLACGLLLVLLLEVLLQEAPSRRHLAAAFAGGLLFGWLGAAGRTASERKAEEWRARLGSKH